jgi:DNA-binding NtrC family response regulator
MTDPTPTHPSPNRRVLIVEDEPRLRAMLLRALPDMGFDPIGAATGEDALRSMEEQPAAVAVLDLNLPGIDGLTVFQQIRDRWPDTQVVVMTGYGDLDAAQQAIRLNVADFLTKPCSLGDLEQALDRAWRRRLDDLGNPPTSKQTTQPTPPPDPDATAEQSRTIQHVEKDLILAALKRHDDNRTETARELGISVRTLYYRLSQYEIEDAN